MKIRKPYLTETILHVKIEGETRLNEEYARHPRDTQLEHRVTRENREERRMDGGKRRFDDWQNRSPAVNYSVARATGLDQ